MKQPKENRPTIYDVASLAGISISTVSRVLNSPDQVNEATRAKVMLAIDQLGFVPKAEARARALQNNRRIGVITPFFTAPSFVQRLRGITATLANTNHELVIYTVDSLPRLQAYLATLPLTGGLDGLIIMSMPFDDDTARRIIDHGLQAVSIEYYHPEFCSVEIDDFAGGQMAAHYLYQKGHQRVAFLGDIDPPDYAIRPVIKRMNGFCQACTEMGITVPDEYIRSCPIDQEPTLQAARQLLSLKERPTAIFAAADIQAIFVLKVAREFGLKIPQDLAILGFDDLDMADYIGLTTIRQPLDDSGRITADLLASGLANPSRPVQHVRLPLTIIERDTV